jgi:hypothetical protein
VNPLRRMPREACRLVGATLLRSTAASNGDVPDSFSATLADPPALAACVA